MKTKWLIFSWLGLPVLAPAAEKPNVLWITGEDMSAKWLGCYGNTRIKTPNFDKLAQEGSYLHQHDHTNEDFDPKAMELAAYHPDIPEMRMDYARYTVGVMNADRALGRILARLEEDGLAGDNVRNLANDSAHAQRLARMREELKQQQNAFSDCGFLPEGILVHRAKEHKATIHDLIRSPKLYDQQEYMRAADLANFAQPSDLPKLVELLGSGDEGYRYWGVIGCIQLGKPAATPEVLRIVENLIKTDAKDERTLDVRVTAALYLCQIEHQKEDALRSLAEVITTASDRSAGKGRAWANVLLLGSKAEGIEGLLKTTKLGRKDQAALTQFQLRLE